jgi:hypothetical protein
MIADITAVDGYFDQAADQIGTSRTNDFIFGPMHEAMRDQLKQGIDANAVSDAIPLAALPSVLPDVPPGQEDLFKLEAPLAVQSQPLRSGFFPFNKFSSVPLFIQAARLAQNEAAGDDFKKRLMIVPGCHVIRLISDGAGNPRRIVAVDTDQGTIQVPVNGVVVLAMGTIENARLALISLPGLPSSARMGSNLMAHLRSNLTIRIPRASISGLPGADSAGEGNCRGARGAAGAGGSRVGGECLRSMPRCRCSASAEERGHQTAACTSFGVRGIRGPPIGSARRKSCDTVPRCAAPPARNRVFR